MANRAESPITLAPNVFYANLATAHEKGRDSYARTEEQLYPTAQALRDIINIEGWSERAKKLVVTLYTDKIQNAYRDHQYPKVMQDHYFTIAELYADRFLSEKDFLRLHEMIQKGLADMWLTYIHDMYEGANSAAGRCKRSVQDYEDRGFISSEQRKMLIDTLEKKFPLLK